MHALKLATVTAPKVPAIEDGVFLASDLPAAYPTIAAPVSDAIAHFMLLARHVSEAIKQWDKGI